MVDGSIYHTKYNPPQKKGKCDKCGSNLYKDACWERIVNILSISLHLLLKVGYLD